MESSLICEYLEQEFPTPRLAPPDAFGRARMRLWSKLVDEQIFEATRELSFSAHFRYKMRTMTEAQRQTRYANVGDPERRARFMSTYEHGVDSPYVYQAIGHFEKAFKAMDASLAEGGGPWLLGADYGLADINMIPFVARMHYLDLIDIWIGERPRVRQWWQRALQRTEHGPRHRRSPHRRGAGRDEGVRRRHPRRGAGQAQRLSRSVKMNCLAARRPP